MKFMACNESDLNASTGVCAAPLWVDQPVGFSLPSVVEYAPVISAILGAVAIAYILRVMHKQAESL